ncbi:PD-(D/E)XK nuclease domain-containing protein [Candidatus Cetobacterium colombiensis]|uniref:PD-(D/E)XK nuclease domain-containing protein n=1 Tax=Candidatus Cetobacterium colombiensis TaxID=3073100 RepID=A0ABU4WFI0_9FUSO|nr:PD-(D/E)XK nuclease domain-containing protein [Candidatus Cetobacterium colombiensis]MDX8337464.1 PD-(D/E)XK nuclease domain-containing protein [Candidatus Cetobacterium colombiensis]
MFRKNKRFKELYLSAISCHDSGDSEKYYHHFMLGLLLTLGDKYIITSNRESGYGRYDIALEPKDKKNFVKKL